MDKLKQAIIEVIKEILKGDLQKVFIFGSRVKNRNLNPHADIDIGIIADKKLTFEELGRIGEEIEKIPTLLKVDIVDFTDREDVFTEEALSKIEVLYEKG